MPHARRYTLIAALGLPALLLAPAVHQANAELAGTSVHVVQPGETLLQIADSLGVDLNTLTSLNKLDNPDVLSVGQTLTVPAASTGGGSAPPATGQQTARASNPGGSTYTVVAGDTLWAIARQFGTTIAALVDANSLDNPDSLTIGAQLSIPGDTSRAAPAPPTGAGPTAAGASSYTVQTGDTLFKIGRQFGMSSASLAQSNGLDDPNRLPMGMVLKLPGGASPQAAPSTQTRQHVVRIGETLKDIAAEEKVDLGVLIDMNSMQDPELLHVGQVVLVPPSPRQAPSDASSIAASAAKPGTLVAAAAPTPAVPVPQPAPPPGPQPAPSPRPQAGSPAATQPKPSDGLAGYAQKFLGARYVFGGSSPAGFDCSGFVWYVARQLDKPIPRGMLGEYNSGPHPKKEDLKPGDIVFFQNTYKPGLSHNGFYLGNGKFIHAADERSGVTISDMNAPFWSAHWFGATRLS